jgi:hypothetical protein
MIIPTVSSRIRFFLIVASIVLIFSVFRLPGLDLPYHQDEWKNVNLSSSVEIAGGFFAHPPLMQMMFVVAYKALGIEWFRVFPLLFSIGAIVLLYLVVSHRASARAGLWAAGLFALCAYNIQGSLSPDVDGAILPFFFLLAMYVYDKWQHSHAAGHTPSFLNTRFFLLIAVLLIGFLIKLNFILVIGVLAIDYIWTHWKSFTYKKGIQSFGVGVGFVGVYIALLYIIQALYPAFSINSMLDHAHQSSGGQGRNWTQIIVQAAKAVYFLSPLLVITPLIVVSRNILIKARPFFLYLGAGFFFYFVAFDFSRAALDKYLLFMIVPLSVIVGMGLAEVFKHISKRTYVFSLSIGGVIALILIALNFLPHSVIALYPKEEWFSKVFHGEWNILNPFIGGNGPMGFYMSFLFIVFSFITSFVLAVVALCKKEWKVSIASILLIIGVAYNAVFAEEFLWGKINGNGPQVLSEMVAFIAHDPTITKVLTYSDIGAGPLSLTGKYAGRIYAIPESEEGYRKKFSEFNGHYMIIDIPHLYEDGFYGRFFARCQVLAQATSGRISGRVYDCREATKIINTL